MRLLPLLLVCGALWAQAPATSADPVVFAVGSTKMTRSEFDALVKNLPEQIRTQIGGDTVEARRRFAEQFAEVILYADEAKRRGLDATPSAKVQMFLQEQSSLAGLLYQQALEASKPTESASKAWFDAHKADFEEAKARHILIRTKGSAVPLKPNQQELSDEDAFAKARTIRERLVKGEDFAAVAKAESDDTGSGAQGGDLGTFGHGRMVPVFEQSAFTLPIGEISQPVKSQFGWHLIQVQARTVKDFAAVKPDIEKQLQAENVQKAMLVFKNSGKAVLDETYFGKPASAVPPQPAPPGRPTP
jgi:peptidyl-prolyl cis-trans isomerase C